MTAALDEILDQYDRGLLNRRQLLTGLALATSGALAGTTAQAQGAPLLPAMSMNHLGLTVADPKKSADFYAAVLGAKVMTSSPDRVTMSFPGSKKGNGMWVSMGKAGGDRKPGYGHIAYGVTVPDTQFAGIADEIKKRFPDVKKGEIVKSAVSDRELFAYDPDGISFQIIPMEREGGG